ncbi:MAG TPA: radical SAM protein [Armatimonadota bacterium]|jgi:heme b synthase
MMRGQQSSDALRVLFWELTARCNLQCRHCRAEAHGETAQGELSTDEVLRIARTIRQDADPILVLTGGEPLTRPDFFRIAEWCVSLFTRVALATNGTLIDEPMAQRIAATGIQRVSVSLDGSSPAIHDHFRGVPGSFDAALRGIAALREAGVSVQINATVTRHNADDLPEILNLTQRVGADAFHVFMLVPVGCGAELDESQRLTPAQSETLLHWLCAQSQALQDRLQIKATCAPQYMRIMREQAAQQGMPLPAPGHGLHTVTRGCLAGSGVCFIGRHGDVQPCGYLPISVGNVRETPLQDIWQQSTLFTALRDPERLTGKCGACEYRTVCQGCRARAFALTGDYLREEPDCPYQPSGHEVSA